MENNYSKKTAYVNSDLETIQLLSEFREGNTNAFSKLYNMYVNLLYSYGCKLTTDMELLKVCCLSVESFAARLLLIQRDNVCCRVTLDYEDESSLVLPLKRLTKGTITFTMNSIRSTTTITPIMDTTAIVAILFL